MGEAEKEVWRVRMMGKREKQKYEKAFEAWKGEYNNQLNIPPFNKWKQKNKREKERENWIRNAILAKEGGRLVLSGGGQLTLALDYIKSKGEGREKALAEMAKQERWGQYYETIKLKHREKLFGIDLMSEMDEETARKILNNEPNKIIGD